jgi:hypothetical protein
MTYLYQQAYARWFAIIGIKKEVTIGFVWVI